MHASGHDVAEAEAKLGIAKRNLETAQRWSASAERAVNQAGLTNAARMMHNVGDSVTEKLLEARIQAEVNLYGTKLVAVTDCTIAYYDELGTAQEAMATLILSGVSNVLIRPPNPSDSRALGGKYELLTAETNKMIAISALRDTQICQLNRFADDQEATQAYLRLHAKGIRTTGCLMQMTGTTNTSERIQILFVLKADEQAARALLTSPARTK
jgi:hypothetical protein